MLLFNELDSKDPIKIYNKYANYPKINKFKKDFFTQKSKYLLWINIYSKNKIFFTIRKRNERILKMSL